MSASTRLDLPEVHKGDVVYVYSANDPMRGRPAVVVSNDRNNHNSLFIEIVFLTDRPRDELGSRCEIMCKGKYIALCEHVTTVHKEKVGSFIRKLSPLEMERIERCLIESFDLSIEIVDTEDLVPVEQEQIDPNPQLVMERDFYKRQYDELLAKVIRGEYK